MKAEHRKELQTNILADRIGKLLQGWRTRPSSSSIFIWIFAALAVALFLAWLYYSSAAAKQRSAAEVALDQAVSVEDLDNIINNNSGTPVARRARFKKADFLINGGLPLLYSAQRDKAVEDVKAAGEIYKELAHESSDVPVLTQQALRGAALAAEVQGDFPQAIKFYQQIVERFPNTLEAKQAKQLAKQLEDNPKEVAGLQETLAKKAEALKPAPSKQGD